jgi:methylthioribose-1-phosphate isomerase
MRLVGASACVTAICPALNALLSAPQVAAGASPYRLLERTGAAFAALKPDTAAYVTVIGWLLHGMAEEASTDRRLAATVLARIARLEAYRAEAGRRIAELGTSLLEDRRSVLVHDYSSSVLAVLERTAATAGPLIAYVTAAEPVRQGAKVARLLAAQGHAVHFLPDTSVGRLIGVVDIVLTGVENLYQDGVLANTVGTFPIALLAARARVPVYGITELLKIAPHNAPEIGELAATTLHEWPGDQVALPEAVVVHREVLDLTPAELVTGYVTEIGLLTPAGVAGALDPVLAELER